MWKRVIYVLLILLFVSFTLLSKVIYEVKPHGIGLQSLEGAKAAIENKKEGFIDDVVVELDEGMYFISSPLEFDVNGGADTNHSVTYRAKEGTHPVISAGENLSSWALVFKDKRIVKASVDHDIRNLWIDGQRMERSQGYTGYATSILTDTIEGEICSGLLLPKEGFPTFEDISGLEIIYYRNWRNYHFKVQAIFDGRFDPIVPEDQVWVIIKDFDIALSQTPKVSIGERNPYYFENALELLDEPGEWCYLPSTKTIYYYLKDDENPQILEAVIPKYQNILTVKSSSTDKVKNLNFLGLTFSHNNWNRSYSDSFISGQSAVYRLKSKKRGMIPSAIELEDAQKILFDSCFIMDIGTNGIHIKNNIDSVEILSCKFNDISGAAISISNYNHNKYSDLTFPVKNVIIDNNLVRNIGVEYGCCAAIQSYYAEDIEISHNEIYDCPYTGIAVGWGWTLKPNTQKNVKVINNKIIGDLKKCYDGGAIYSLSHFGDEGLLIEGNYIEESITNKLAKTEGAIYTDEGSSNVRINNNVVITNRNWFYYNKAGKVEVDTVFVLQDNRNSYGGHKLPSGETEIFFHENGSNIFNITQETAQRIKQNAGNRRVKTR